MDKVTRIGVSLEPELLIPFDKVLEQKGYTSRSEAIRDLIRDMLSENEWKNEDDEMAGVLVIVYTTVAGSTLEKLSNACHDNKSILVSRTTLELDGNNKMDVMITDGKLSELKSFLTDITSIKGVLRGRYTVISPNSGNIHHIGIRN